jgi:hypothetical protein
VALLTLGRLSDFLGRKPVLLTALAVSPGTGAGTGALVSALAVRFLPAPEHLIYLVLLAVVILQAIGVSLMGETVSRKPGAFRTLTPDARLPRGLRGPVLAAAPVLFAVWALAGLYGALGPSLVQALTGDEDVVLGGLSLTVLTATAVASIIALRNTKASTVMRTGITALIAGVAVTMLALTIKWGCPPWRPGSSPSTAPGLQAPPWTTPPR